MKNYRKALKTFFIKRTMALFGMFLFRVLLLLQFVTFFTFLLENYYLQAIRNNL